MKVLFGWLYSHCHCHHWWMCVFQIWCRYRCMSLVYLVWFFWLLPWNFVTISHPFIWSGFQLIHFVFRWFMRLFQHYYCPWLRYINVLFFVMRYFFGIFTLRSFAHPLWSTNSWKSVSLRDMCKYILWHHWHRTVHIPSDLSTNFKTKMKIIINLHIICMGDS